MIWLWIPYGVGAAIAYVLTVRSFLRSAAKAKQTLIEKKRSEINIQYYRDRYDVQLRGLVWVSPLAAAAWPFLLFVIATIKLTEGSSKLLDKVVDATMKEPNQ
jgi:hypothetical protein